MVIKRTNRHVSKRMNWRLVFLILKHTLKVEYALHTDWVAVYIYIYIYVTRREIRIETSV